MTDAGATYYRCSRFSMWFCLVAGLLSLPSAVVVFLFTGGRGQIIVTAWLVGSGIYLLTKASRLRWSLPASITVTPTGVVARLGSKRREIVWDQVWYLYRAKKSATPGPVGWIVAVDRRWALDAAGGALYFTPYDRAVVPQVCQQVVQRAALRWVDMTRGEAVPPNAMPTACAVRTTSWGSG